MLLKKAESTIKKYGMLSDGDKVLIGVSGGSDSVFLLHLLNHLKEKYQLSLHVAHLNHGFRKEAVKEFDFVKKLAKNLEIPFTGKTTNVPSYAKEKRLSKQEAAREARHSFFKEVVKEIGADKIALGHTADDQAETFLMRMIRGSGARGMGGIHPLKAETRDERQETSIINNSSLITRHSSLFIIRPLIEIGRKEIMDYLKKERIPHIKDPSNISNVYLRNRIRNELIPYIEKRYNPKARETFANNARILRDEESFLEDYTERVLPDILTLRKKGRIEISLKSFLNLDKAIQRRLVRIIIEELKGSLKGFSMKHINRVLESIATGQTGRKINLPKGVVIQRDYDHLSFYFKDSRLQTSDSKFKSYNISVPGLTRILKYGLTIDTEIKYPPVDSGNGKVQAAFDLEKISDKIRIRKRKDGDLFFPIGMGGKSKKLKNYFIDEKIRRDERDKIPLLVAGDDILWVIGHRQDGRYKVEEGTKKVLLIKAEKDVD